jgi:hypothetical protein
MALAPAPAPGPPVLVAPSRIPQAGMGLFAGQDISAGQLLCYYGGSLVDPVDAKYLDPSYIVEFELGKGFKLVGDQEDNDLGIYANSVHPDNPSLSANARFDLRGKQYTAGMKRGRFPVKATRNIAAGEEIIVDYGKSYWKTVEKWRLEGPPQKPSSAIARDLRAARRHAQS